VPCAPAFKDIQVQTAAIALRALLANSKQVRALPNAAIVQRVCIHREWRRIPTKTAYSARLAPILAVVRSVAYCVVREQYRLLAALCVVVI